MSPADRVGTMIYWRNLGQSWSEMFRGSFTAGGFVTAGAHWLGLGKSSALALGIVSTLFWPALAVGCGWAVWRWRIIHAQLERERDNTPAVSEQLELLRAMRADMAVIRKTWCPVREYRLTGLCPCCRSTAGLLDGTGHCSLCHHNGVHPHPLEQGEFA